MFRIFFFLIISHLLIENQFQSRFDDWKNANIEIQRHNILFNNLYEIKAMVDVQNVFTVERELVKQLKVSGFYILLYPNSTYCGPFHMSEYQR